MIQKGTYAVITGGTRNYKPCIYSSCQSPTECHAGASPSKDLREFVPPGIGCFTLTLEPLQFPGHETIAVGFLASQQDKNRLFFIAAFLSQWVSSFPRSQKETRTIRNFFTTATSCSERVTSAPPSERGSRIHPEAASPGCLPMLYHATMWQWHQILSCLLSSLTPSLRTISSSSHLCGRIPWSSPACWMDLSSSQTYPMASMNNDELPKCGIGITYVHILPRKQHVILYISWYILSTCIQWNFPLFSGGKLLPAQESSASFWVEASLSSNSLPDAVGFQRFNCAVRGSLQVDAHISMSFSHAPHVPLSLCVFKNLKTWIFKGVVHLMIQAAAKVYIPPQLKPSCKRAAYFGCPDTVVAAPAAQIAAFLVPASWAGRGKWQNGSQLLS